MLRKIITMAAIATIGGLSIGASCQKAAETLRSSGLDLGSSGNKALSIGASAGDNLINKSWDEEDIGQAFAVSMTTSPGLFSDEKLNDYVTNVGLVIASVSGSQSIDFTFGIINSNEVSAVSGPNGYIFISRGAIAKMEDESELAGVLAHEIAHVIERHGMKALTNSRIGSFGADSVKTLSENQLVDEVTDVLNDYKGIVYNPSQEGESDRLAVKYLKAANYNPTGLERFIARELASVKTDLRSHPPTADRLEKLKAVIGPNPTGQRNAERFKAAVGK